MRENRLRTLLNEGKPTIGTRVQSSWPTVIEMVGRSGQFDYVEFLAEYAPYSLHDLDNLGRAIELSPDFCGMIKMEQSAQGHAGGGRGGARPPRARGPAATAGPRPSRSPPTSAA